MSYKVDLEIYNGPMDLLLYLIRREEVDIREIPISRIADQYIAYLDLLKNLDIELAGDFVVMAATLLELKSRALLPRPVEPEAGEDAADLEDPRETLIRQLIEYRRFKDAAVMLDERGREMSRRYPRQLDEERLKALGAEDDAVPSDFLQGVEIWDLISAFSQVVRTLGYSKAREVVYDDTPIEEAAVELLARIEREKSILFSQVFVKGAGLSHLITTFLAVLELVRQRRIGAEQEADFKDVRLFLRDPSTEAPPQQITPKGADESQDALDRKGPRRPSAQRLQDLREQMDEVDFEKTEFDEILDSIHVPDVEAFRPIYSDDEVMGRKAPDADEAPAGSPPVEATDAAPAADAAPPPADDASPEDGPEAAEDEKP
jgi:segregation and condensation protein A